MHSQSDSVSVAAPSKLGVNIAGYVNSEFGLGEGVRATIRAIAAADIPFVINNSTFNLHRKLDSTYTNFSETNPYSINIVQVNVDLLNFFVDQVGFEYFKDRYNIGFWAWELPEFPQEWNWAFELFDEIWTYSSFCAEAIAAVSPIPVVKMMPSISLPQATMGREALGIPKEKFIFLFMFDFCSAFERKNPVATIQAFKQAFGDNHPDAQLVIKFSNAELFPQEREQLYALAEGCDSIQLIDGYLLKEEINALVYSCDCYVSLHRAEGFGLTMAEAMFYGKPVIATGYSANTEFMNLNNSFLVQYDLVTLSQDFVPYKKGNVWAEPDVDHAAHLMRQVFENPEQAQQVGAKAAQDICTLLGPQTVGQKIKNRLMHMVPSTVSTDVAAQLRQTRTQLSTAQARESQGYLKLQQVQQELERSQAELEQWKTQVAAMQTSKFWQLRNAWFRLKNKVRGSQDI